MTFRPFKHLAAIACVSLASPPGVASAETVLFVGNSFTFGAYSPVRAYAPATVNDLNHEQIGGVPAIFKTFTRAMGMEWDVSLETSPGQDLAFHLTQKRAEIGKHWDYVILQGLSTLSMSEPGNPATHVAAANGLADLFHQQNPKAKVFLQSTWSRADLAYVQQSPWLGQPIERMAEDISEKSKAAVAPSGKLAGTIEVGKAWNLAFQQKIADPNPYDGIDFGRVSLWTWDQYHASAEGYYLAALMIFGSITKIDPRLLTGKETAAQDLGINPQVARRLQDVAATELKFPPLPAEVEAERAKVFWIGPDGRPVGPVGGRSATLPGPADQSNTSHSPAASAPTRPH
ncbi:DUF4886 domain-containing protein [Novosphingobium sp.]|uniref:DUF4886 domain-containing protein n=1 Tax=Novosphingobium sp. TaxID=1874826 RepID=UPI001EC3337A|nr:DUF4886 domain-containing protein [Novosphingobium sp.]MBK6801021.1 PEP-CTERM sorting domain-containing protein [Novosphingobium sp.]MBK9011579.1 PEP-CTERM sorting domain-containing protein [Novosphingobium sp.]